MDNNNWRNDPDKLRAIAREYDEVAQYWAAHDRDPQYAESLFVQARDMRAAAARIERRREEAAHKRAEARRAALVESVMNTLYDK